MKIGIFPASGGLGASTYTHLLKIVDPADVTLISRHPNKISSKHKAAGVTCIQAGWSTTAEAYDHVFDGIHCLFLISYPSFEFERRVDYHRIAIDAARKSGVVHIFYSSLGFAGTDGILSAAYVMQAHLDTEEYLAALAAEDKGFTYTSIREGLYSESFGMYTSFFDPKDPIDEVLLPLFDGSGSGVAWVKRDELGEGTARLIEMFTKAPSAKEFQFVNQILLLSGPETWSLKDTIEFLGQTTGKKIPTRKVSVEEYARQDRVKQGLGTESVRKAILWATAFEAIRQGETGIVTPELEQLLGRRPEGFKQTIKELYSR